MSSNIAPTRSTHTSSNNQKTGESLKSTEYGDYSLFAFEELWRDRATFLRRSGYLLRPRYQPDWSPSWADSRIDPYRCEDSISPYGVFNVIDGIRIADGKRVSIKVVENLNELAIAATLGSGSALRNVDNHCVPILEILNDPLNPAHKLMVMPYLRPFNDPAFTTIGEIFDFIDQTLQGMHFMHDQGIAHRDAAIANIMMDGTPLYPQGHHPVLISSTLDGCGTVYPTYSRTEKPVRYYFIDFGLSTQFFEGQSHLVVGDKGRDKSAPEMSKIVPYDAFKIDVYMLGNVYKKEFLSKHDGLTFLDPLISKMTCPVPAQRPTIQEAISDFNDLRSRLDISTLRWRLRLKGESTTTRVMSDAAAAVREGLYRFKGFLS